MAILHGRAARIEHEDGIYFVIEADGSSRAYKRLAEIGEEEERKQAETIFWKEE
jgi:hypothetical protein